MPEDFCPRAKIFVIKKWVNTGCTTKCCEGVTLMAINVTMMNNLILLFTS